MFAVGQILSYSVCVALLFCDLATATEQQPATVRVLSYNIHHGEGTDGQLDLQRIAEVIRRADADVVVLQEVDVNTTRTGGVDQAAELARLLEMNYRFGKSIDYAGGAYGNAILSRWEILQDVVHELPAPRTTTERRTILEVHVQIPEEISTGDHSRLIVLGTHWDHQRAEENRVASAEFVIGNLLGKYFFGGETRAVPTSRSWLLAGDLNAVPESKPLEILGERSWQVPQKALPTSPAGAPRRQIDYILPLKTGVLEIVEYEVLDEPVASDHRPILGVFRVVKE